METARLYKFIHTDKNIHPLQAKTLGYFFARNGVAVTQRQQKKLEKHNIYVEFISDAYIAEHEGNINQIVDTLVEKQNEG